MLSYLLLRGRCRSCGWRIHIRYPLIELSAAVCVLTAVLLSDGLLSAGVRAVFVLAMIAVTIIDLEHRIIPDEISLPGVALGLLGAPLVGVGRIDALIGAGAGAGALLAVAMGYRWVRGVDGMGMGDVKLAAMIGAFLGWKGIVMTVTLGSALGCVVAAGLLLGRRANRQTALPYGTFLAPTAALLILIGGSLWEWYGALLLPE